MIVLFLILVLLIKLSMRNALDKKKLNFVLIILGILSIVIPFITINDPENLLVIFKANIFDVWIITAGLFILSCNQLYLMISEPELGDKTLLTKYLYIGLLIISINLVWIKVFICLLMLIRVNIKNIQNKVIFDLELPLTIVVIMLSVGDVIPYTAYITPVIFAILVLHTLFKRNTAEKTFILILLSSITLSKSEASNQFVLYTITSMNFLLALYFMQHKEVKVKVIEILNSSFYIEKILIKLKYKLMNNFVYLNRDEMTTEAEVKSKTQPMRYVSSDYIRNYLLILTLVLFTIILGIKV